MKSIIEHVVLFKVKDDIATAKIDSMVKAINSLVSTIDEILHLTISPIIRLQSSPSSSLNFTHILHSRYSSTENLLAYAVHPAHVAVVNANAPLLDDTMALDWVTVVPGDAVVKPPGSAGRVTFFKLKEGLGGEVSGEVLGGIKGIRHGKVVQFTCGENFSHGRAKGFNFASLEVFNGRGELEEADCDGEIGNYYGDDEFKQHLESVLVLDFVVEEGKLASS